VGRAAGKVVYKVFGGGKEKSGLSRIWVIPKRVREHFPGKRGKEKRHTNKNTKKHPEAGRGKCLAVNN